MAISNYRMLIRHIDRQQIASVEQFLAIPLTPMVLSDMNRFEDCDEFIMRSVQQLVARTARCYEAFSHPVMVNSLRLHNAERLKWAQTRSLREFKQCITLHQLVKEYVSGIHHLETGNVSTRSENGTALSCCVDTTTSEFPTSPSLGANYSLDNIEVRPSCSEHLSLPRENGTFLMQEPNKSRYFKVTQKNDFDHGKLHPDKMSFQLALEMLRPKESILDVLFNEASIRSDPLNDWFYYYCQQRAAWRVLHEHLLCLTRPDIYPQVVYNDVKILDLLQTASNIVAEIYANLTVGGKGLIIHLEEDFSILEHPPPSENFLASSSGISLDQKHLVEKHSLPQPSLSIHAIREHLLYVFREILKNACAATVRWASGISIDVKFATNDKWVVVEFIDHAGGIDPRFTKDIWKFGWTSHKYDKGHLGGFGVGLPISKVYMDMWRGTIDVYSVFKKGSTVRVSFPKSPIEILACINI